MKVTIKVRPTGGYNGAAWPKVGDTIDLPDHVAEGMISTGAAEKAKAAKAAPSKPDESEKRPATSKSVETRKA